MIRIFENQLDQKLQQGDTYRYFLLVGQDPYLQNNVLTRIKAHLNSNHHFDKYQYTINAECKWDEMLMITQSQGLFASETLIHLQFNEANLTAEINKKLAELCSSLANEVYLIFTISKLTKANENAAWFRQLASELMIINCNAPDAKQLPMWVNNQLAKHKLSLEPQSISLLCYYYEGNLLALSQILEQLYLLFPNKKISFQDIQQYLTDMAIFTPFHWIDSLYSLKIKRAIHILTQLKTADLEPLILLRVFQQELILLINLKKSSQTNNLKSAYDQYNVWQNKRNLLTPYLTKVSLNSLYQNLKQLVDIELMIKSDFSSSIWTELESLTLTFIKQIDNA